ncbi:MAG: hypothetical protein QF902_01795 [Rhodospirillales bacterium]|nr:hypothetical protein [Rhodospirillales bacterium]
MKHRSLVAAAVAPVAVAVLLLSGCDQPDLKPLEEVLSNDKEHDFVDLRIKITRESVPRQTGGSFRPDRTVALCGKDNGDGSSTYWVDEVLSCSPYWTKYFACEEQILKNCGLVPITRGMF